MLPKALQLPGNQHSKPSAAKTCSHNMFMKCQMPPNAIVTVPCTRHTFIPNTEPILFLPHFHIFLTYVSPQILSVLAQPQPLQQRSLLFTNSFSNADFIQPLSPHPVKTPVPFQPCFTPSFLTYWLSESKHFQVWLSVCCYFTSYESHLQSSSPCLLSPTQASQGAQNLTSQQSPTIYEGTLREK